MRRFLRKRNTFNMAKSKKKVIDSIYKIAFADLSDFGFFYEDENGETLYKLKKKKEIDVKKLAAISSFKQNDRNIEIKLVDKIKLLNLLLKYIDEPSDAKSDIRISFDSGIEKFAK